MNDRTKAPDLENAAPDTTRPLDAALNSDDVTNFSLGVESRASDDFSAVPDEIPALGRYRITQILGQGGFGLVYLAYDEQLQRDVAIKVAHRGRVSDAAAAAAYVAEARIVANLDHPHIVPVYDVGSTADCRCFIVSKFIDGNTLAERMQRNRPKPDAAAELVATIAEALHHAHHRGLVHRDIKPGNILLDASGEPFVVDFGLALREENVGRGPEYAGTPAYMSPEQARGEGHRVDGRSDIFGLGVVFYELLVGRRPFKGDTKAELLDQIATLEPRPPRQYDDEIPKELERICLQCLAKRVSERYSTAKDLADDLRHYLKQSGRISTTNDLPALAPSTNPGLNSQPVKIVPKGLRSFDAYDADFFIELLPGARDRDGLPDSIRFWKNQIEEQDVERSFSVGLISGPSGCGKSSLVKAGLLPRLASNVIAIYVEATADETEIRLLHALRKRCSAVADNLTLTETLTALRRGQGLPTGKRLLIVIDQFEQWLHVRKDEQNTELVHALRQCDGDRLKCIVMVRDDFWMAVLRFMRELEVRLVEGRNSAAVDLFDLGHAHKVLAAFGSAFGKLPDTRHGLSSDQKEFLSQAVAGLAQEGRVIAVRLALLAEMLKGKAWTPATLQEMGGTAGVGVTFLEETFSAATAQPEHRYHQKAARNVLKSLLPESGANIKGHLRSAAELLAASGYQTRAQDFADLLRILDSEIRLITPTDPEGQEPESGAAATKTQAGQKYYQLTHDYLVPSLRDWLTRKQQETRKGRAELVLADRAAVWNARPENRQLPSFWQRLQILGLTTSKDWTPPQRKMMRQAARFHGLRSCIAALVLLAVGIGGVAVRSAVVADRASALVEALLVAPPQADPYAVENLTPVRSHALPILRQRVGEESGNATNRLHAVLALAQFGAPDFLFLISMIGRAPLAECTNIVTALRRDPAAAVSQLKTQFAAEQDPKIQLPLAVVALHFGETKPAQEMLALGPDPSRRTLLIDELHKWRASLVEYAPLLQNTDDADFQSGICQALGRIPVTEVSDEERQALVPVLRKLYTTCRHAPTHSASRWALSQWKIDLPPVAITKPPLEQDWYINPVGMTFLKIPAGSFLRTDKDGKSLGRVSQPRTIWLGDCEVTRSQFEQFIADPVSPPEDKPTDWTVSEMSVSTAGYPADNINWFDALLFCNWLSRREGLRPCYERTTDEVGGWRCDSDAPGYRLPTGVEWENACRAKSETHYGFGNDESKLSQYAVFLSPTPKHVAGRQPNGWGLFDMHGNVSEWSQDLEIDFAKAPETAPGTVLPEFRVMRGGCYFLLPLYVRTADRDPTLATRRYNNMGFRVARNVSSPTKQ